MPRKNEPIKMELVPAPTVKEIKESCRVLLTNEQLLEAGSELAASQGEVSQLEDDFKSVRDEWKSRISAVEARITALAGRISRGYEFKSVACIVRFDTPELGLKTCERKDTGERVWVKEMTDEDKQMDLPMVIPAEQVEPEGENAPEAANQEEGGY